MVVLQLQKHAFISRLKNSMKYSDIPIPREEQNATLASRMADTPYESVCHNSSQDQTLSSFLFPYISRSRTLFTHGGISRGGDYFLLFIVSKIDLPESPFRVYATSARRTLVFSIAGTRLDLFISSQVYAVSHIAVILPNHIHLTDADTPALHRNSSRL